MSTPLEYEEFDLDRAESPVTRYELFVVAKRLHLMILAARNEVIARAFDDLPRAEKGARKFSQFEETFEKEIKTLLHGGDMTDLFE